MISIICICNKDDIYENYLHKSLINQIEVTYEIIKINSKDYNFSNASDALNYATGKANGDYLVICHQDISFDDKLFLKKIETFCKTYEFGIAGLAGVEMTIERKVFSNIVMGPDFISAGVKIDTIKEVAALDECILILKKSNDIVFDSFDTWHFYAVDYSLKCYQKGEKVYVLPFEMYHLSPGWSLDGSYWKALKKISKKYKMLKIIPTTVSKYKNNIFLSFSIFLRKIKRWFKRR